LARKKRKAGLGWIASGLLSIVDATGLTFFFAVVIQANQEKLLTADAAED